jgi:transposase
MDYTAGVDVSKDRLHLAVRASDGEWVVEHQSFANAETGFQALVECLPRTEGILQLGVEASGGYERQLVSWLMDEPEFEVSRLNPRRVKDFAKSKGRRAKTDAVDARTIAHFVATHDPNPAEDPDSTQEKLKRLSRHLDHLKDSRARKKSYQESLSDPFLEDQVQETIEDYDRQIDEVKERIEELQDQDEMVSRTIDYVATIDGVGDETACQLLPELANGFDPESIEPRSEAAHSGLTPEINQSGTSVDHQSMSKRGNSRIRKLLYYPTLSAIQCNPVIRDFYERLIDRGKDEMVAVVASMRKLLHIIVGVIKNQAEFDPNWETKKA